MKRHERNHVFLAAFGTLLLLLGPIGFGWADEPAKPAKPLDGRAILKRYDKNGDGRLSVEERQAIREDLIRGRIQLPQKLRDRLKTIAQQRGIDPAVLAKVTIKRDVEYGRAGDRPLRLDLVRPKTPSDKPRPVIVFIHGGGWQAGDKAGGITHVAPLVATGDYIGASVGYRLSGEATWPAQIHDCKAAIRWLSANAARLGINPKRIGVWGTSAGGHLVNMLGTTSDVASLEGASGSPGGSSRVACVVAFCGPTDLRTIIQGKAQATQGPLVKLLGGPVKEKAEAAASASPIAFVTKDDPPFLLVHGTRDPLVPLSQAETFDAKLKASGVDSTLIVVQNAGHSLVGRETLKRVEAFFAKHLLNRPVDVPATPITAP